MARPKGIPNKVGAQAKENIIAVFTRIGGTAQMASWAKKNLTDFYRLYARLIPTEVTGTVDVRDARELSDNELADIIALASRNGAIGTAISEQESREVH